MIRLIKFKARFNFDIDEDTHTSLIECRENILKSSQARILEEFFRMLESGYSSNFFKLLKSFGFLKLLVPKLDEFMETDLSIYKYLNAADDLILKDFRHKMDRAILTCCLLFPIMETEINTLFEKMKKIHLGLIYDTGREVIKNTFSSFFYIPKRTKAQVNSILTNQYRLTPIDNKKKLVRIPRDSFFYLAMKFFKIRCSLNPDLLETYILWNEKITKLHKKRQGRRRKV